MAKLTPYLKIFGLLLMLSVFSTSSIAQYKLQIQPVDKDSSFLATLKINRSFTSQEQCSNYISRLPGILKSKNYPNASVDSVRYESGWAWVQLYVGEPAGVVVLRYDSAEDVLLRQVGYRQNKKPLTSTQLEYLQNDILTYLENNGYPFASVALRDVTLDGDTIAGNLQIDKGPLYKIDSIRNMGRASLSEGYLQQYLGIRHGSIYRKDKLKTVSARLRELPFIREVQPWNMSLLGTGSVLNLYLDPKKSSEVNVLIGLLPANEQLKNNKMLVTGDANINLKNALGGGETIGLNWQQIQVKSPRLNLLFQQPYLFGSPFGLNFNFDLFKKDSSFVNIGILVGASYAVSSAQTGSVFIQRLTTNLLTVDTIRVKATRKLPAEADISSVNLGVSYEWNKTDYRFNPRRGTEWSVSGSVGTRTIRKNNVIVKMYDNNDPEFDYNSLYDTFQLKSYQFRIRLKGARYFPLGKASTFKLGLSSGWFQSPSVFRNELFQIGGYKLLRGFDEESIFASAYAVGTAEYRYLIGQNSFLAAFVDYGASQNKSVAVRGNNRFFGAGIAMAFETKAGIFNITYAAGKRDDQKFNLRQSKIHLGYVNYF